MHVNSNEVRDKERGSGRSTLLYRIYQLQKIIKLSEIVPKKSISTCCWSGEAGIFLNSETNIKVGRKEFPTEFLQRIIPAVSHSATLPDSHHRNSHPKTMPLASGADCTSREILVKNPGSSQTTDCKPAS